MTTIRELTTLWGFKVDDKALDALDKRFDALVSTVNRVGAVAIGAAATMFGLATSAAESGAEIKHAADRIGISTEALQEYQYAARLAGQSNQGFAGSLQGLVKNVFDARRGLGGAREAFYLLGNALGKDLLAKGMSAEDLLNNVADGLNRVADPSRKLELATQLFGGDAGAMLTTLKGGASGLAKLRQEARATGVVMSGPAVEAAEEYARQWERTKSTVVGLKNTLGVALFPVVEKLMGSFRRWAGVNREWLALRLHEAFGILQSFISRTLFVVERLTSVANTAAIALGGWNRVLRLVTTALVVLLSLRIAAFVGSLVQVLGKAALAFKLFGEAGLLASFEVVAIGAAVVGLLLILEDIVAYFQGRQSITGLMLADFQGLSSSIDKWLEPVLAKLGAFGKRVGKAIVDGLAELNAADWQKVGTFIMNALELVLKVSTIPLQIGWAIAGGIMDGLVDGLRKKFPKLASMLGLEEGTAGTKLGAGAAPMDASGTKIFGMSATDAIKWAAEKSGFIATPPAPGAASAGSSSSNSNVFNIDARQNVTVPPGTPPEKIPAVTTEAVKGVVDGILRETGRATAGAVAH